MEGLTSQRISRFVHPLGLYLSTDILCSHTIRPHRLPPTRAGQNAICMTSDCRSYSPLVPNTIPLTNTRKNGKDLKAARYMYKRYKLLLHVCSSGPSVPICKSRKGFAKFVFGFNFVGPTLLRSLRLLPAV
jgi:hypothetical protein